MFTGLVEGVGEILEITRMAEGVRLAIAPPFPVAELALGESVAVAGACLTVAALTPQAFKVEASPETLAALLYP
jgi:riboflavin synthase